MNDAPVESNKFDIGSFSSEGQVSTELSSRRTGMSLQRTRLSADRTLMSVIRTSLSLIAFGFTIYQFLGKLKEGHGASASPRNFGMAMVSLGIAVLVIGIVYHAQFMTGMRVERHQMVKAGLIHGESHFPVSFTLIAAVLLLGIGITAIVSMAFNIGPFD